MPEKINQKGPRGTIKPSEAMPGTASKFRAHKKKWFWRFGWFELHPEYQDYDVIAFRQGPKWRRLFWKLWVRTR